MEWPKEDLLLCCIFINLPFPSFLGLAAVLLHPVPFMQSYQFNVSELRRESGLPSKDLSNAILSIQAGTIRFLKSSKILRKEI
jgi:hypothetical protein